MDGIKSVDIENRYFELNNDAIQSGYHLNPDKSFTYGLIEGLLTNKMRYGYESCPCRLSRGERTSDSDIICPCDYRDADLDEYGACYCGLYVSEVIVKQNLLAPVVPERRLLHPDPIEISKNNLSGLFPYPIWRCKVCGYLCARSAPPEKCPICKVDKDRFELFI